MTKSQILQFLVYIYSSTYNTMILRSSYIRIGRSIPTILLVWLLITKQQIAGMTYILLRGTGSNCLSVDPLPGSTIDIKYHLPGMNYDLVVDVVFNTFVIA